MTTQTRTTTDRIRGATDGIEAGLVVVSFGIAIVQGGVGGYIAIILTLIAAWVVLPALRAGGA